jgi:hypothetical protein
MILKRCSSPEVTVLNDLKDFAARPEQLSGFGEQPRILHQISSQLPLRVAVEVSSLFPRKDVLAVVAANILS